MSDSEELRALVLGLEQPRGLTCAVRRISPAEDGEALARQARACLEGGEFALFERIRSHKRRAEFCAGRAAARDALSRTEVPLPCGSVEILRDPKGAPRIVLRPSAPPGGGPRTRDVRNGGGWEPPSKLPHLSISHSGEFAIAVAAPWPVGVDLERIEDRPESLWRHFLCETERAVLNEQPAADRNRLSNLLWARKEAACKVGGWGASIPFRGFDCSSELTVIEGRRIALCSATSCGFAVALAYEVDPAMRGCLHGETTLGHTHSGAKFAQIGP